MVGLAVALAATMMWWRFRGSSTSSTTVAIAVPASTPTSASNHSLTSPALPVPPRPVLPASSDRVEGPAVPETSDEDTPAYPVDLESLRSKIPDNRYWDLAAPTSDPVVAQARAQRALRSNKAYGRILANEASAVEIREYYGEKKRISTDYLELVSLVLKEKANDLPERDRALFELTASLHRARLDQIARDLADALARSNGRNPPP
jgi:hypothetical protein